MSRGQYNLSFYWNYLAKWPDLFTAAVSPSGALMGYSALWRGHTVTVVAGGGAAVACAIGAVIGKAEGSDVLWHGHVSCVTVAPEYRRLGLAKVLMDDLERIADKA